MAGSAGGAGHGEGARAAVHDRCREGGGRGRAMCGGDRGTVVRGRRSCSRYCRRYGVGGGGRGGNELADDDGNIVVIATVSLTAERGKGRYYEERVKNTKGIRAEPRLSGIVRFWCKQ